jgi:hypothetical protein
MINPRSSLRLLLLAAVVALPLSRIGAADAPAAKTITPGENLVVDGIPPIPGEITEKVGRYTEARAAVFSDWHPTKPEMLIGTRFADTAQVHLVNHPGWRTHAAHLFP